MIKMTYNERKEYFKDRFNNDAGVYIMRLLDIIADLTPKDDEQHDYWYEYCVKIGMCNSETLDFLDAYSHEDAWIEEDL